MSKLEIVKRPFRPDPKLNFVYMEIRSTEPKEMVEDRGFQRQWKINQFHFIHRDGLPLWLRKSHDETWKDSLGLSQEEFDLLVSEFKSLLDPVR